MAEYMVNPFSVTDVKKELEASNKVISARIDDLEQINTELSGIWEGLAQEAYREALSKEIVTLQNYQAVISEYCIALSDIAAGYYGIEQQNADIALLPAK